MKEKDVSKMKRDLEEYYDNTRERLEQNNRRNKFVNPKGSYERKFLRGKTK